MATFSPEQYAEKINKLIAKAESTTPAEAELLLAKAQELMTRYAINQALLDQTSKGKRDEIEQHTFVYGGGYAVEKGELSWIILRANDCRGIYYRSDSFTQPEEIDGKTFRMWYKLIATGFRSDLDRAIMLDASLQLQMAKAMSEWWKAEDRSWMSKSQNFRAHHSFLRGFTDGIRTRLTKAAEAGKRAAKRDATARGEDEESVALVLRSRKDRVDDWMDNHYGKLSPGRGGYYSNDGAAHSAGHAAGHRADVGQPGIRQRKQLDR